MLHKTDPTDLKPCWHMRTLVSAWTDGRLKGLAKWYTERHVHDCPQCQSSLPFLSALHGRLFALAGGEKEPIKEPIKESMAEERLTEERWQAVERAWQETEKKP